jgi:gamma-glutamylcyclotransferase (GGCT)/AIG2-like uncharacterized protein YtfP
MQFDWPSLIFTYGSLMSTADADVGRAERRQLGGAARLLGPASVRGLLFDVGPYPAAVLTSSGEDTIHGEIWRLPSRRRWLLDVLDRYEGCTRDHPTPHAYARRRVWVTTDDGRGVVAWVYLWNRPLGAMPRIEGGRWRGGESEGRAFRWSDPTHWVANSGLGSQGVAASGPHT